MKVKVTFEKSALGFILDAFNKSIDEEGYIIEKDNPKQRVLTPKGEEILADEFGGVYTDEDGNMLFAKSDIVSLMELVLVDI